MDIGSAPTWFRQVSSPASQNHFNHCLAPYPSLTSAPDYPNGLKTYTILIHEHQICYHHTDTFLVSKYLKIEFAAGAADPADGPHSTLQCPDLPRPPSWIWRAASRREWDGRAKEKKVGEGKGGERMGWKGY